jgi:hypothetical protein
MKEHSRDQGALDSLGHLCERLPAGVREHAHNVGLSAAADDNALALRGCESGLDQFDNHVDREPVRTQDRLAVTVTARGTQFEGAAAVRIGTAIVASGRHRACAGPGITILFRRFMPQGGKTVSALARKRVHDEHVPFAVKQHRLVADHQGIGDPKDVWNWQPPVPKHQIKFDETTASQRTRTNTSGIADVGEYY